MIVQKKVSAQGKFAKVGEDIKDGDIVTILDGGTVTTGEYGEQNVFKIKVKSGEDMNKSFNQSTMNNLIDAFGEDTNVWQGQTVKAFVVKVMVTGKMRNVAYFAPDGWTMRDDGSFDHGDGTEEINVQEIEF